MTTENTNDKESREGSSFNNEDGNQARKKRTRVGDLRKQRYDIAPERNPYKAGNSGNDSYERPERPSYNNERGNSDYQSSGERRPYSQDNRGTGNRPYSDNRDNRGGYSQGGGERRPYSQDNRGGGNRSYSDNRDNRGGYSQGGGERRPYSQDNRGSGNRSYSDNRDNRGGYSQGGGERRPYSQDNRGGGNRSYSDNRDNRGGYSQGGGERRPYSQDNRGGGNRPYSDNRGGYNNPRNSRPSAPRPARVIRPVKFKENLDPSTEIRLNKYLANAGVCSRREADAFITEGLVRVNGEIVNELGSKVLVSDIVSFRDKPVRLESKVYVLLNKPKNCVTTSDDPQNRTTVMDLVKDACDERIYPVGRLDRNTTGVLLLTNDGDLASKLMHPKYLKKKIYQVTLDRDVTMEDMQAIADGVELEDGEIHADSIAYQAEDVLNVVGIEIHSGRNRIVRRIFEKLNYKVVNLDRVYFAGLTKKNVRRGQWRYLTEKEVNILRMGAFE